MFKVCVFIDGEYLRKGAQELGYSTNPLEKLAAGIAAPHHLVRTYFYDCLPYQSDPPTPQEQENFGRKEKFFKRIENLSKFQVRLGYVRLMGRDSQKGPIFQQKGVDVFLATDLMTMALRGKIDVACLVTGDGDFVPVVSAVKDAGVSVHLFYFKNKTAGYALNYGRLATNEPRLHPSFWMDGASRNWVTDVITSPCPLNPDEREKAPGSTGQGTGPRPPRGQGRAAGSTVEGPALTPGRARAKMRHPAPGREKTSSGLPGGGLPWPRSICS